MRRVSAPSPRASAWGAHAVEKPARQRPPWGGGSRARDTDGMFWRSTLTGAFLCAARPPDIWKPRAASSRASIAGCAAGLIAAIVLRARLVGLTRAGRQLGPGRTAPQCGLPGLHRHELRPRGGQNRARTGTLRRGRGAGLPPQRRRPHVPPRRWRRHRLARPAGERAITGTALPRRRGGMMPAALLDDPPRQGSLPHWRG